MVSKFPQTRKQTSNRIRRIFCCFNFFQKVFKDLDKFMDKVLQIIKRVQIGLKTFVLMIV